MRMIKRDIVAAAITSKDSKLFLGKKNPKKGGVYIDCWHLPGGGKEEGETDLKALQREIIEETGIDIHNAQIQLIDSQGKGDSEKTLLSGETVIVKMNFHVFSVRLPVAAQTIKLRLEDDIAEGMWVRKSDLPLLKLTPPSKELIERIGIDALFI